MLLVFRYQSIRRTIAQARHASPSQQIPPNCSGNIESQQQISSQQNQHSNQQQQQTAPLPALTLLIRPDFYSLLHTNQVKISNDTKLL